MKSIMFVLCAATVLVAGTSYGTAGLMRRELTPEERLVYMQQEHGPQWRAMSLPQRCERRKEMRQQFASMKPADLQKLKQQLDARWNAMPAAERKRIEERIAERRARPARSSGQAHKSPCADASP